MVWRLDAEAFCEPRHRRLLALREFRRRPGSHFSPDTADVRATGFANNSLFANGTKNP
jgi:hypothetical protein